jgi:hypothetical protein
VRKEHGLRAAALTQTNPEEPIQKFFGITLEVNKKRLTASGKSLPLSLIPNEGILHFNIDIATENILYFKI